MHRMYLSIYVWPFLANVASHILHGLPFVEAYLNDISLIHSGNILFDLSGNIVGVLYATGHVNGT